MEGFEKTRLHAFQEELTALCKKYGIANDQSHLYSINPPRVEWHQKFITDTRILDIAH